MGEAVSWWVNFCLKNKRICKRSCTRKYSKWNVRDHLHVRKCLAILKANHASKHRWKKCWREWSHVIIWQTEVKSEGIMHYDLLSKQLKLVAVNLFRSLPTGGKYKQWMQKLQKKVNYMQVIVSLRWCYHIVLDHSLPGRKWILIGIGYTNI